MANEVLFMKRREFKYVLDEKQTKYFEEALAKHMQVDNYGLTTICSLYYDTPDYYLIRLSIEKPAFKEKLRIRSYNLAKDEDSMVFLEIKRKADKIVYKRRAVIPLKVATDFMDGKDEVFADPQTYKEIKYFRDYYKNLKPACLILYDRVAYFDPSSDLRITVDHKPRYRLDKLDLTSSTEGKLILPTSGHSVVEVKTEMALPLWLLDIFNKGNIVRGSFSKYGEAYKQDIIKHSMKKEGK